MKNVLVVLAHPDMSQSIANKIIRDGLTDEFNAEVRDLYQLYPTFNIDVEKEQDYLKKSDVVIFQFPWYWYSSPAILKDYLDKVFDFNFAYGPTGDKLRGKHLIVSTTVGGPEDGYRPGGPNHFYIDDLIKPLEETALKTGMIWYRAVRSHQMIYVPDIYHAKSEIEERASNHSKELNSKVQSIIENSPQNTIESFMGEFFLNIDQSTEAGYFTQHLSNRLEFDFRGDVFHGHDGFIQWYTKTLSLLNGNMKHEFSNIEINEIKPREYEVFFDMTMMGTLKDGQEIKNQGRDQWIISLTPGNRVQLQSYKIN